MKCPKCGNEISIAIGTKIITKNCRVLTNLTTIATVQCEQCDSIFQASVEGKTFMSVKDDK